MFREIHECKFREVTAESYNQPIPALPGELEKRLASYGDFLKVSPEEKEAGLRMLDARLERKLAAIREAQKRNRV